MAGEPIEKHQLAGFDDRSRGFNRVVEVRLAGQAYRAILAYEARHIAAGEAGSEHAALQVLIRLLHEHGFTQLRSQLSFRGADYLGSREPWIEYPDPRRPVAAGLLARWFGWLGRHRTQP
jgi:hypothetical protein